MSRCTKGRSDTEEFKTHFPTPLAETEDTIDVSPISGDALQKWGNVSPSWDRKSVVYVVVTGVVWDCSQVTVWVTIRFHLALCIH